MPTATVVSTMKAAEIAKPGSTFRIVEGKILEPAVVMVQFQVHGCGVCHGESLVLEGSRPGVALLRNDYLLRRIHGQEGSGRAG